MTIEQAKKELERPLMFGDSLQIKAIEVLENAISDETVSLVKDLVEDYNTGFGMTTRDLIRELADIMKER